jgi:LacI family transcriptional regulator
MFLSHKSINDVVVIWMERYVNGKYLYGKVYEALSNKIALGEYSLNDLLPSEQTIGRIFDVDRTTVRKALQLLVDDGIVEKLPGIGTKVVSSSSPRKREAPLNPCNNSIAFFLPRSKSHENRITQPFYSSLFYNVEASCRRHGYQVYYSTLDETDDIDGIMGNGNFAGILFISNIYRPHMDYALERHIPCVLINSYCEDIPSVLEDNTEGAYLSCKYLISMGHKKIAIIRGIPDYTSSRERLRGCLYAMYEGNVPVCEKYIMNGEWDAASGYREVEQLFRKLSAKQLPTAIMAFNDGSAFGAIQAITQLGLKVPGDISIIGFDNVDQAQYSVPSLTTVDTDIPLMAAVAVENLLRQIADGYAANVKILTPVKLIIRDSVSFPRNMPAESVNPVFS